MPKENFKIYEDMIVDLLNNYKNLVIEPYEDGCNLTKVKQLHKEFLDGQFETFTDNFKEVEL